VRRVQFSLRGMLISLTVLSILTSAAVQWWRQPYVLYGTYPNGVRAWEQTNQRTFDGRLVSLGIIRYYHNGQRAYEYASADDTKRFWSPEGNGIEEDDFWRLYHSHLLPYVKRDPRSRHAWPFERRSQGK
jgi:hypothetical protein